MANYLGLIGAEAFAANRFKNYRRTVFYYYPQGAAPLTGILSLMREEVTNDPEFHWEEKRKSTQIVSTAAISSNISWYTSGIVISGGVITAANAAGSNITTVVGTQYAIQLASDPTTMFRINHLIQTVQVDASGNQYVVVGQVNALNNASQSIPNVVGFTALVAVGAFAYNNASNIGINVVVVGNANAEAQVGSTDNVYTVPLDVNNLTQIFRTSYQMSGTALKTSAKFDDRGVFPDQAKEAMLNHATEMEKNFIWGQQTLTSTVVGGSTQTVRTTGGIMWFLAQWEKGSTYGNAAASLDTDDTKRIIINSTGILAYRTFLGYGERVFRMTNNKTSEKLAFVGSGAMNILTQMFASKLVLMQKPPAGETYGMELTQVIVPFGTLWLKTHPLFSENSIWRNSMLIIDVPNLRYRFLAGRDTELLRDRQPRNADYVENEYLTECGLEVNFPESHMYIQNILDFAP